ncbi:formyl transferase [Desulfocurvus sp. DL9XJH121]
MKLVLCVKRDILGNVALNRLAPALAAHEVTVLLSDKVMPEERAPGVPADQLFFERDLAVDHLFPALDAAPGLPDAELLTFSGLARRHGMPMDIVRNINAPETVDRLRALAPDLMLSCRFDLIFREEAIRTPRLGLYNLHPGALPAYRGLYAPFRALVNGEERMGCTLHAIDPGIDTGPVVDIAWIKADPAKSVLRHYLELYVAGADLFLAMLRDVEAGKLPSATPQDQDRARYFKYPTDQEFEDFRRGGGRLYDTLEIRDVLSRFGSAASD